MDGLIQGKVSYVYVCNMLYYKKKRHKCHTGFRYSLLTFSCGGNASDTAAAAAAAAAGQGGAAAAVAAAVNPTVGPGAIVSHFAHTDLGTAGSVDFNLGLLNRIQRMTRYTSFSNLMDVPTDCPTRERAGWTGDGQLTSPVVSYNFDAGAFYRKWLRDIGDAQRFFRSECMGTGSPPDDCDCKFDDCTGEVPPAAPWYVRQRAHPVPSLPKPAQERPTLARGVPCARVGPWGRHEARTADPCVHLYRGPAVDKR